MKHLTMAMLVLTLLSYFSCTPSLLETSTESSSDAMSPTTVSRSIETIGPSMASILLQYPDLANNIIAEAKKQFDGDYDV